MTIEELGERVGASHSTIRQIERGSPSARVGVAFEAASILGIPLFDEDPVRVGLEARRVSSDLALLPKRIHKVPADNDF